MFGFFNIVILGCEFLESEITNIIILIILIGLIPEAARSKASVFGLRLPELWIRIPPGRRCLSLASVVCCQVEVSASG